MDDDYFEPEMFDGAAAPDYMQLPAMEAKGPSEVPEQEQEQEQVQVQVEIQVPVTTASERLAHALKELTDLLDQIDDDSRLEYERACNDAISMYSKNQTKAKQIISKVCPNILLCGQLLDAVMYVRSRLNGVNMPNDVVIFDA